jgi:ABC-type uncharacterized transport system auxiliary subunit
MTYGAIRHVVIAALLLPLAACGGLRSKEPLDQVYLLRAAAISAAAPAQPPVAGVVALYRPEVQPGLESERIALVRSGNRLDYYAASRWSGSLPHVIEAFATQTLLSSGRFELINDSEHGSGGARFLLSLTVRHFEADYSADEKAAPTVHVAFECVLLEGVTHTPLGRCDGEALVSAQANRMESIVQAFEAAARQAMERVVTQIATLAARG